ncbi:WhiB family transcriptional regulator [Streptomyces sp. LHD-70]|nr:WhiB family transcriptional regulator [Streptomyces sp. LHD-70]MDQ8705323.1 WhiB family transcriptional regulator [Streptomyces sp. LHD-70]
MGAPVLVTACAHEDPEVFFPDGAAGSAVRDLIVAKSVCRRCPVRMECLDRALDTGQRTGVWGGTAEEERKRLRRTVRR